MVCFCCVSKAGMGSFSLNNSETILQIWTDLWESSSVSKARADRHWCSMWRVWTSLLHRAMLEARWSADWKSVHGRLCQWTIESLVCPTLSTDYKTISLFQADEEDTSLLSLSTVLPVAVGNEAPPFLHPRRKSVLWNCWSSLDIDAVTEYVENWNAFHERSPSA